MDAKFATILDNEHVQQQIFFHRKSMFSKFLGGKIHATKIVQLEPIIASKQHLQLPQHSIRQTLGPMINVELK
jgi:hypothetical protein